MCFLNISMLLIYCKHQLIFRINKCLYKCKSDLNVDDDFGRGSLGPSLALIRGLHGHQKY